MDNGAPNIRENKCLTEKYVRDIERRGKSEANELSTGENPQALLDKLMEIQGNVRLSNGSIYWKEEEKKEKLENLVNNIINNEYGSIISLMDTEMDIKLVGGDNDMDDIKDDMSVESEQMDIPEVEDRTDYEDDEDFEDNTHIEDESEVEDKTDYEDDEDFEDNTEVEEETDENIILEVYKRQLINNITQGSAKNTHRLIHLYKDDIDEIDPELFDVMDNLIKNNEANEWLSFDPEQTSKGRGRLIKDNMTGFSDIEFPDNEEESEEDFNFDEDAFSDLLDDENKPEHPILYARAIDIVVLLHESVKAIYEYIGAGGIPQDSEIAEYVLNFTDTLDNEFVDLKYGVYLKRDLLDFVNVNEDVVDFNNGFEYIWARLVELDSKQFIELFSSIFIEENHNKVLTVDIRTGEEYVSITGNSRKIIDKIFEIIVDEIHNYEQEMEEYERNMNEWEEYNKFIEDNPDYEFEQEDETEQEIVPESTKEISMSQRDIQSEIDRIIDEEDISDPSVKEKLNELSSILN